ncbi:MAG: YegS/Rv2252/BmrU family lipid kinase [Sphingobacteriales bacterium]|nr:YegS/Rv2252/BmrU family lipid kinase [Sphingobacteriales bacterium]
MSRHILYIINPIAGTRTKKGLQQLIEKKTREAGIPFRVVPSVAGGDYSFLVPIIKEFGITDVVVAGGDGTISQVVSSLMQAPVDFGIIPCGSGNGLAFTAGIPGQPEKAVDLVLNGKASTIDGFTVNGQFACMLAGIGFDAKVAHEFARQKERGLKKYASLVSKNFFNAAPYPFIIESNGLSFSTEAFFVSIANSNQFGNHVTIAPKALLADGFLDIVIAKKSSKPVLLFSLIKQILAGKLDKMESSLKHPVIYFQTEKIKIKNSAGAPMHIDGDPVESAEEIRVQILKNCFRLIQP